MDCTTAKPSGLEMLLGISAIVFLALMVIDLFLRYENRKKDKAGLIPYQLIFTPLIWFFSQLKNYFSSSRFSSTPFQDVDKRSAERNSGK